MRKNIIVSLALFSALFMGCKRSEDPIEMEDGGYGCLCLNVGMSQESKAGVYDDILANAKVSIYKADFTGLVRQYTYSNVPDVIYLPADRYRVDVEAGEITKDSPALASWDSKSYFGSTEFTIEADKVEDVLVNAGICNAVTKVSFDASVEENIEEGFTFTIGTNLESDNEKLVYVKEHDSDAGYFIIDGFEPSLKWSFDGVSRKNAKPVHASGEIPAVEKGKLYKMQAKYTVTDGDFSFSISIDKDTDDLDDIIVFDPVSSGLVPSAAHEIWAGHATLHAELDEKEAGEDAKVQFSISTDDETWTEIDAIRDEPGVYSCKATSLTPSTLYTYRLMVNGEQIGEPLKFTTEAAPQLPNSDFEATSNAESSRYASFFDPDSEKEECRTKFWDNGNSASAGYGFVISDSSTDVPEGIGSTKSAVLQSTYAVVKFAAGNLFTGEFGGLSGTNGKVNFGRPFTSRPTALRLWYKYYGGTVNRGKDGVISNGEYDIASIQVMVGTWDYKKYGGTATCPVQVNTGDSKTFWKYQELPETLAYGDFEERGTGSAGEWKQITINLDYRNETEHPKFIIVSAASSKFGDYFAGCDSSKLWLDNIELLYE